jgi:hypothetical protein
MVDLLLIAPFAIVLVDLLLIATMEKGEIRRSINTMAKRGNKKKVNHYNGKWAIRRSINTMAKGAIRSTNTMAKGAIRSIG